MNHLSYLKSDYNELNLLSDKQSDEILIEGAVETTIQTLHDKELFDKNDKANEVVKDYVLIEVGERHRPYLDPLGVQSNP